MGMVPNGLLPNVAAGVTRRLDGESWAVAEDRTAELIARIQPNSSSEGQRLAVFNYVQRLIMKCLSCQVVTFGSVPLKTYLPDGDIDVTAFSDNEELKDAWATVVRDALEHEEKSESAEFRVKEVQYIQAEVKIIKCLVENIVVDISFNQVGGLCTLCFLEEIDNLINQNHLFKRSIILIKAWCYYESRILGAHHGLISTYALETLVLYIFHVFNNCFAGPLEVLYRFLEFFSKFDWEKFCVSLWGPVPISSLPDMAAEPPRKDSGELLLSKSFLEKCSSFYAVTPLENQGQPFVSKHFNVIDPLRTNNNLGRSVSKGNFFRIRSAFAFGAKRLARLLECPKEDLVVEVSQFFTNTWRRHGSGNRPDAPTPSLVHQQPLKTVPVEVPNNHRSTKILKKKTENHIFCIDQDNLTEGGHSYHDPTSQLLNKISLHSQNSPRTVNPAVSHGQSQKIYGMQADNKSSEQLERNSNPGRPVQAEKYQRAPNTHFMNDMNGQSRSRFARTHSSPELTESSVDGFSRVRRATGVEMEKSPKVDYSSRGNNLILEMSTNHIAVSSQDGPVSSMNSSSNPSVKTASDSNSVSSNYCEDIGFALNEEPASVSEALEMQHEKSQEEQVLVNLMASTRLHGFDGQVQLPMQIPSYLSAASSPLLASTAHLQRNLAALSPTNFSLIGAPWLSNVQFLQGFGPPPMTHYVHSPTFAQHTEDGNESEKSATSDVNCDDGDNWHDHGAGLSRNFAHERRDPQMFHFEGKEHHPSPDSVSGAHLQGQPKFGPCLQGQPKFGTEDGVLGENHADIFHNQTNRRTSINSNMRSGNVRFASSQASASRNKTLPDSSWDASTGKTQRSSRDKWGKRPAFAATATAAHSKTKSSWQTENADHVRAERNDDIKNGDAIPLAKNDISDITVGSVSSSAQSQTSQVLDDYDPSEISIPNPVFAPFLIGSPQQRQVDNSGLTFVQTGPPVPFVMWFPRNTDGSAPQFERNEGTDQFPVNAAVQNFGLLDAHQPDANITSASSSIITDLSDEHKSDILNSDFVSHWQNLQYGRFCQGVRPLGPLLYPFALPPVYLQGHVPWDGPGRPPLPNVNWTQVMGPGQQVLPVMPLQPAPERASGVFQRYGEDAPRYRGGTGTYLPTPKVPFRNRQSSTRNYRGSLNSDRGDHSDREGSWINSKQRNVGRSYGHDQSERAVMRPDRQAAGESQSDRQCQSYRNDSYRHEAGAPYLIQSHSFESVNSTRRPGNMMYGVYSPPSTASSGDGALPGSSMPPAAVLYSCEQGVNYAASTEPLEFGSLRPVATTDSSDVPQPTHEGLTNGFYEQRHAPYRGGSCRSSPDQPSSPHLWR